MSLLQRAQGGNFATVENLERQNGTRKRAPQACRRCHEQKIRCTGSRPCDQCMRRGQACRFKDVRQKVKVTQDYNINRQRGLEFPGYNAERTAPSSAGFLHSDEQRTGTQEVDQLELSEQYQQTTFRQSYGINHELPFPLQEASAHRQTSPEVALTNPLVGHSMNYVFDGKNRPVFMGTASNWAFGRRVLVMTYESLLRKQLPSDNLHFPDETYDLEWDGTKTGAVDIDLHPNNLPSPDFARHLIDVVKFRCGPLLYLFEEETFMNQFSLFHENTSTASQPPLLWYIHYLLIISFGKAFIVQSSKTQKPPGTDTFVQAMKLLPNLAFFDADPIQLTQVLCCTALYLQGLHFRSSAYRVIGEAVRVALLHGMHTGMRTLAIDDATVLRYSRAWWTVYVLERWITCLLGLPMSIADDAISAPLPVAPDSNQQTLITEIQVKLHRILAQVLQTVYGVEGRLDKEFLRTTKAALKSIADVTDQLNSNFCILGSDAATGISRSSAHLHLLHHQCIVMTTRPLLYSCLQAKLGKSTQTLRRLIHSSGIRALLQICTDSAQKMLTILSALSDQGLLESFLPFDLEATFTSSIALTIVAAIDRSMLDGHSRWSQYAFSILDEMSFRGNKVSKMMKSELQQLEGLLVLLSPADREQTDQTQELSRQPVFQGDSGPQSDIPSSSFQSCGIPPQHRSSFSMDDPVWDEGFTTAQLIDVANAVDIDGLNWFSPSCLDIP